MRACVAPVKVVCYASGTRPSRWGHHCQRPRLSLTLHVPRASPKEDGWPLPYRKETGQLVDAILTRQSVKILLHFLSETNGESHLWLNEYLSRVGPPKVDSDNSARVWLTEMGAQPPAKVSDPGRSSAPSPAGFEQAVHGVRDVNPRDLLTRLLALRLELAQELIGDLNKVQTANTDILRAVLARTLSEMPPLEE